MNPNMLMPRVPSASQSNEILRLRLCGFRWLERRSNDPMHMLSFLLKASSRVVVWDGEATERKARPI